LGNGQENKDSKMSFWNRPKEGFKNNEDSKMRTWDQAQNKDSNIMRIQT
jgi:hypothetical protein